MDSSCSVCSKKFENEKNKLLACGNCELVVHQGCYGVCKLPNLGKWFCRKCESQVRMSKIKCEFCPLKSGAFKPSNGNRCGWSHVLCALYIPETKFSDNQLMDLIMVDAVPSDRYNKSCIFCESNQMNTMANYGVCMQCSWKNCKLYFHASCAAQAGALVYPLTNMCTAENTIAKLVKGTTEEKTVFKVSAEDCNFHGFCCSGHMTKYLNSLPVPASNTKKLNGEQKYTRSSVQGTITNSFTFTDSASLSSSTRSGSKNSISEGIEKETTESSSPSSTADLSCSSDSSHLKPLPVSTGKPMVSEESKVVSLSMKLNFESDPININSNPSEPETVIVDSLLCNPPKLAINCKVESDIFSSKPTNSISASISSPSRTEENNGAVYRRLSRRNTAILVNKKFALQRNSTYAVKEDKLQSEQKIATVSTALASNSAISSVSSPAVSEQQLMLPRSRQRTVIALTALPTSTRKGSLAVKNKANLVERVQRARKLRSRLSRKVLAPGSKKIKGSPIPVIETTASKPKPLHAIHQQPLVPDWYLPANSCNPLKLVPPPRPTSLRGLGLPRQQHTPLFSDSMVPPLEHKHGEQLTTIEDLLEWQWDQGGALLMQQAEGADVVSLLNCLHQLKSENDSLETKLIRLQSKREHLRSVNARLTNSLSALEMMATDNQQHAEAYASTNQNYDCSKDSTTVPITSESLNFSASKRPASQVSSLDVSLKRQDVSGSSSSITGNHCPTMLPSVTPYQTSCLQTSVSLSFTNQNSALEQILHGYIVDSSYQQQYQDIKQRSSPNISVNGSNKHSVPSLNGDLAMRSLDKRTLNMLPKLQPRGGSRQLNNGGNWDGSMCSPIPSSTHEKRNISPNPSQSNGMSIAISNIYSPQQTRTVRPIQPSVTRQQQYQQNTNSASLPPKNSRTNPPPIVRLMSAILTGGGSGDNINQELASNASSCSSTATSSTTPASAISPSSISPTDEVSPTTPLPPISVTASRNFASALLVDSSLPLSSSSSAATTVYSTADAITPLSISSCSNDVNHPPSLPLIIFSSANGSGIIPDTCAITGTESSVE